MVIPKNIEETMAKYKKNDLKQSLLLAIRFHEQITPERLSMP
jgi:hypothetical protein